MNLFSSYSCFPAILIFEQGRYHYHQIPLCLLELFGGNGLPKRNEWYKLRQAQNVTFLKKWIDAWPEHADPSPLLGWALDGALNIEKLKL